MHRFFAFVLAAAPAVVFAQQAPRYYPEDHRPPLFLRETWKVPPTVEAAPTQDLLDNPALSMQLYGPGAKQLEIVHHAAPKDEPSYVWSGMTEGSWVLTLRDKNQLVDLSGPVAKIRWRIKEAGFHQLRPVVKLADGTWLAGDHAEGYTVDWYETEFPIANMRWRRLDIAKAVEAEDGKWVDNPDLSRVDEIGFTDLAPGSGHGAGGATRVDWMEVYGNPVARTAVSTTASAQSTGAAR